MNLSELLQERKRLREKLHILSVQISDREVEARLKRIAKDREEYYDRNKRAYDLRESGKTWQEVSVILGRSKGVCKSHWQCHKWHLEHSEKAKTHPLCESDSVNDLVLSVRVANCLNNADIYTIGQITERSPTEFLKYRNFGKYSLSELMLVLRKAGIRWEKAE